MRARAPYPRRRAVFAVTYLLVRALYFPMVIFSQVVPDLLGLLSSATPPPVSKGSLGAILAAALALTALQLHWGKLLVEQALGQARPGSLLGGKEKKAK